MEENSAAYRSRQLKNVTHVARTVMGLIFIVSGFVKVVDPWGTAIKVDEYFVIYGWEWLMPYSMWFAIWLCGAEMLMGCMLTFKVRIRFVSICALTSMSIFTIVTLLSATLLPVEDCGCFGEVLKLTPWQTFLKNLCLLPFATIVWWRYRPDKIFSFKKLEALLAVSFFSITMGIGVYSYLHLPLIDFLPYKVGVNLPKAIEEAKLADGGDVETVLIYRNLKSGKLREFSIEDTAWQNEEKWEWVDTKTIMEESPILRPMVSEFALLSGDGTDVTSEVLATPGALNMIFVTRFNKMSDRCKERIARYVEDAQNRGESVIYVTPERLRQDRFGLDGYNIDPTTMKTALRANVGLIKLVDGVIVRKANCIDI